MKPPQSGVAKLYKRDLMMSSDRLHGQSDTLGKVYQFYIQKVDFQKSRSRSKVSLSLGRQQNEWIWKMLQRDCQQDLIQCQNEGIRREEKK